MIGYVMVGTNNLDASIKFYDEILEIIGLERVETIEDDYAAYAQKGKMRSYVLIPDGYVAQGKLAQALVYGAEIIAIKGNFDKALDIVRDLSEKYPITLVNSVNPYRLQGQKQRLLK